MDVALAEAGFAALAGVGLAESEEEEEAEALDAGALAAGFDAAPGDRRLLSRMSRAEAAANARKKRRKGVRADDYAKLSDAWNFLHGLRHGDHVGEKVKDLHTNAWTVAGMLQVGYKAVGKNAPGCSAAIGETTHNIEALIASADLLEKAQEKTQNKYWRRPKPNKKYIYWRRPKHKEKCKNNIGEGPSESVFFTVARGSRHPRRAPWSLHCVGSRCHTMAMSLRTNGELGDGACALPDPRR